MRQPLVLLLAGSAALAAVAGCSEEAAVYLGGPPGPAAKQHLSNSGLVLVVGDSVALGARVEDAVGNTLSTAPSVASCDNAVVTVGSATADPVYTTGVWLHAAGLGVSCVVVSSAGFADTVRITTGPAALKVVGLNPDATEDTVGSGNKVTFGVIAVNRAGDTLPGTTAYDWTSSSAAVLAVHRLTGEASGKSTGTVSVRVRAPGGAMDSKSARVVAGVFAGTLSAATAGPGALVTATRAADGPFFDADASVTVGGVAGFADSWTPSTLTFAVPATGSTAAAVLGLSNMGPSQVQQNGTFTVNATDADIYSPANLDGTCSGVPTAPLWSSIASPAGNVYLVHSGGTPSCLETLADTASDHYFRYATTAAKSISLTLTWAATTPTATDMDLGVCTLDFSDCTFGFSSATTTEVLNNVALDANTTYYVIMMPWQKGATRINMKLNIR
jgi:hypothetical protein